MCLFIGFELCALIHVFKPVPVLYFFEILFLILAAFFTWTWLFHLTLKVEKIDRSEERCPLNV